MSLERGYIGSVRFPLKNMYRARTFAVRNVNALKEETVWGHVSLCTDEPVCSESFKSCFKSQTHCVRRDEIPAGQQTEHRPTLQNLYVNNVGNGAASCFYPYKVG